MALLGLKMQIAHWVTTTILAEQSHFWNLVFIRIKVLLTIWIMFNLHTKLLPTNFQSTGEFTQTLQHLFHRLRHTRIGTHSSCTAHTGLKPKHCQRYWMPFYTSILPLSLYYAIPRLLSCRMIPKWGGTFTQNEPKGPFWTVSFILAFVWTPIWTTTA